jgi:hypothetical protein
MKHVKNYDSFNNSIVKEGLGTFFLVLSGIGVIYLARKIKKFIDKVGVFLPSVQLKSFLNKIEEIEISKEGEIIVKERGNLKIIAIKIDGKVFDSLTVNTDNSEVYMGNSFKKDKDGEPILDNRIVPMVLPKNANTEEVKKIKEIEEDLVTDLLSVISKYSKESL